MDHPSILPVGMMRFVIVAGPTVIGWSELELGDAPMGVAFGRFYPSDGYVSSIHTAPGVALQARPEESTLFLEASGGAYIADYSRDLGPDAIEVSVLGIETGMYTRFFPHHIRSYEEQFPAL